MQSFLFLFLLLVIVGVAALIGYAMQLVSFDKAGARLTRVIRNETFAAILRQEVIQIIISFNID